MANFHRIVAAFLIALVSLVWWSSANAALDAPAIKYTYAGQYGTAQEMGTALCQAAYVKPPDRGRTAKNIRPPAVVGQAALFDCWDPIASVFVSYNQGVISSYQCTPNATVGSGTCTCNSGFTESATKSCLNNAQTVVEALNLLGAPLLYKGALNASLTTCYAGAVVKGTGGVQGGTQSELYGPFTTDGTTCTPDVDKAVAPSPCKVGEFPGTVNGVSVCVPPVSTDVQIVSGDVKTASAPSGAASSPTSGLGNDAPPTATSSTTSTSCTGGSCTTTTIYNNAAGAQVGTKTETQTPKSFCVENPAAVICKASDSSFSASACGTVPACTGDAIQCAQARSSFDTACALAPPPSAESALYDSSKGKSNAEIRSSFGGSSVAIGSSSFNQTDIIGNPAGVADLVVTVMGRQITLEMSLVNVWLGRLGNLLFGLSFIVAAAIVFRKG